MKRILKWGLIIFVVIPLILGILSVLTVSFTQNGSGSQQELRKEIEEKNKQTNAKVNFTGTTFVITNNNDFDWERAEIVVNEKYRYEANNIKANTVYEVGAGQFIDDKNYRFNPFEMKPSEIRIFVKEPLSDDWYGTIIN